MTDFDRIRLKTIRAKLMACQKLTINPKILGLLTEAEIICRRLGDSLPTPETSNSESSSPTSIAGLTRDERRSQIRDEKIERLKSQIHVGGVLK